MELIVLGSGSKGNCYVLHNGREALMIEAGVPFKEVLQTLGKELTKKIQMVIITHEHQDHAKYAKDWLDHGVRVYATEGTVNAIKKHHSRTRVWYMKPYPFRARSVENKQLPWLPFEAPGGLTVMPFRTVHDAADPCGFVISCEDMGKLMFATDTNFLPSRFADISHYMIEANYEEKLLEERTDIPDSLKERIRSNHMSVDTCIGALLANDLRATRNIILMHISEGDGDVDAFAKKVREKTGINTFVAEKGLTMNLSKYPF